MRDRLELGPVPADEDCAQVGADNYAVQAARECRAYIKQLKRQFGEPPLGCRFVVTSNAHDFSTYHEVAIQYDDAYGDPPVEFAFKVEREAPTVWDDEARAELKASSAPCPVCSGTVCGDLVPRCER